MLSNSPQALLYYLNHFETIDYITFMWFLVLLFLFFILGMMLLRKYTNLAIFMIILIAIIGLSGPLFIKWYLNNSIRKSEFTIKNTKQLNFTNTFIINGELKNLSKKNFSTCKIYIGFYKYSKNRFKKYFNGFKAVKTYIKTIDKPLKVGEISDVRIVLDNFKIANDINVSAISECYK